MNRRDRKKQQKRKQRADRLRIERHYTQLEAPLDEDALDDDDESEVDDEFEAEAETGISTFLWEPAIRDARLASLAQTLPGKGDWIAARDELAAREEPPDDSPVNTDRATREALRAGRRRLKQLRKEGFRVEVETALSGARRWHETAAETEARIELLTREVERGTAVVVERPRDRDVWADAASRTVLRSRLNLALALHDTGRSDQARALLEQNLELDPADRTHARWTLLGFALERGDHAEATGLLEALHSDTSSVVVWARVLHAIVVGDEQRAEAALAAARRDYPGCEVMLTPFGEGEREAAYEAERRAELFEVVAQLGRAWKCQPQAIEWIARHAR